MQESTRHHERIVRSERSTPLFRGRLWESLTRTHIAVPLVIFYGAAIVLVSYSLYLGVIAPWSNLFLFAVGLIVFTLAEYLIHRFAFHIDTDTPAKERFQYLFHGIHHDFPRDKSRLAMPPVASILLASAFFAVYRIVMGYYGLPFTAGFLAGYAAYLCVHYSVHAFRPPRNMLKVLWTHHAIHHFQQPDAAFGVSSPFWDRIFGTMPKRKSKSGTA
jgi:sterol desaturase/sphingolipid hydroxylase (fatty acid hydroxylase superfamily)